MLLEQTNFEASALISAVCEMLISVIRLANG